MMFFESEETLERTLQRFLAEHRMHMGLVSPEAPLISNLPVWSNIALIRQYHENIPAEAARKFVLGLLKRFDMTGIADQRTSSLKNDELFCAMLIRATMVRAAVVVLDRPFRILPHDRNGCFLMESLQKIDDLIAEAHIFDYTREKGRYETDGAAD
jgi:ABC-type lipopolysaccharide export system ATPase subunit